MINLVAIVLMSGTVTKLTRDYFEQRQQGVVPYFHSARYPELAGEIAPDIWRER